MGNLAKSRVGRERMAAMRAARPGWPDRENDAYREQAWRTARAGGIHVPVLIFTGKQDTLSWDADDPYGMIRRELGFFDIVGTKNPHVKLIVINEAGHFPYREHPEQFNGDLTQFIEFWSRAPRGSF
jgi:pimeloyl-ACP methyl ester carboxylesterase